MILAKRVAAIFIMLIVPGIVALALLGVAGAMPQKREVPTVTPASLPDRAIKLAVEAAVTERMEPAPAQDLWVDNVATFDGWAFGTVAKVAPPAEDAAPESLLFLARLVDEAWRVALQHTPLFDRWLVGAPEELVSARARDMLLANGDGPPLLSLPWAVGDTWRLTGGPHHNCGWGWSGCDTDDRPWSSLDFNVPTGQYGGEVRAAREGIAYRPCGNQVIIEHADGWQTGYYHMENIAVSHGQAVPRGALLGYTGTGTGCGGYATGPHVHFSLRQNGEHQELNGREIGNWYVLEGADQYEGCMLQGGAAQCAPSGLILNDGTYGGAVLATAAWTADDEWHPQPVYEHGDPIRWVLNVDNQGLQEVQIELSFRIVAPDGSQRASWDGQVTTPPGAVSWGLPGEIGPVDGGTYVFTGTVTYLGVTSTEVTSYGVNGPTPTPSATPLETSTPTGTPLPTATPLPASPACRDVQLTIPDNEPAGITDTLTVNDPAILVDLDVTLAVTHTWVGDLEFRLRHLESGTMVTLMDRPGVPASTYGCGGDDMSVVFDDAAGIPIETACGTGVPALSGLYAPEEALQAFYGEPLAGSWQLIAYDRANNDLGTLNGWCLLPTSGIVPTPTPDTTPAPAIMPTPTPTPSPTPRPLTEKHFLPLLWGAIP